MGLEPLKILISEDISESLAAEAVTGNISAAGFSGCYISDMLSDVMANASEGDIWITMQIHPNIVAVAVVKGLAGIILTGGRMPQTETIKKAEAEGVLIMTTPLSTFEAAGRMYNIVGSRAGTDEKVQG